MKNMLFILSCMTVAVCMTGCKENTAANAAKALNDPLKQESNFIKDAIRHRSPDLQKVDLIGNSVVYTHIFDGIIDVKTYTYDGDVCVEAERVYTFPTQMSALRHYRRAVEKADLYDNIELFNNEVRYNLKEAQHKLETEGLTKDQLKAKFDKQISDAKADMHRHNERIKADLRKDGQCIENDMNCCKKK